MPTSQLRDVGPGKPETSLQIPYRSAPLRIRRVATTTHPAGAAANACSIQRPNPLILWHLLSLDAPTVAALWTWFLARANRIELPATAVIAMAVAVWMLYAADRLLDARLLDGPHVHAAHDLEARHLFHHRNRRAFRFGIVLASLALAMLLPRIEPKSIHLYLVLGGLLAGYFVLIHLYDEPRSPSQKASRLPKELAVGIFFSAAAFIPTVARQPGLRLTLLPGAILFAALCSLNCLFIYAWEHTADSPNTHPATRVALRWLPDLAVAAVACSLLVAIADHALPWQIALACALATGLLLLVHRNRLRFAPTSLRAAADLCLLTPMLLLTTLHHL